MGFFDAFNQATRTDNFMSPFGEAGLLGDPLHYTIGDKYDNFMRKTWEKPNEIVGKGITKFDTFDRKINPIHRAIDRTEIGGKIKDFVHNKPGDSALAILGSIYGGGALAGNGFGGMFGSQGGQGLGVFSNGGQGGLAGVGGGNTGALASQGGIGGGAGMGTAGSAAGPGALGLSSNWQNYMKAGQSVQGLLGQNQQQQQGPKPYLYKGQIVWM